MNNEIIDRAMRADLEVVYGFICEAQYAICEARADMDRNDPLAAIGRIIDMPDDLDDIALWIKGIISMHRKKEF